MTPEAGPAPISPLDAARVRLQDLPPAVAESLRQAGNTRRWQRGQTVLCQGQHTGALVVALQGKLAALLGSTLGKTTLLRLVDEGELLALPDVLAHLPSPVTVVAQGPASTLHIGREALMQVLREQPEGAIGLAVLLARRLGELFRYVELTSAQPLGERLRFAMQRLARHQAMPDGAGGLRLTVTQAELAAATSASRQRVHLALQQWQAGGHLRLGYRSITLLPGPQGWARLAL